MADKRMFSNSVVTTDRFFDMPMSARLLYYDMGMKADDDGFVWPQIILKLNGSTADDLRILVARNYLIPFDSGVFVIRHWKVNNYIRKKLYKKTLCTEEFEKLSMGVDKIYSLKRSFDEPAGRLQEWLTAICGSGITE